LPVFGGFFDVVDDEGVGGDFDGGDAEAEAVDVPVGEGVGIVGVDGTFGQLRVGVVDSVEHEVVMAGEASVIQDGVTEVLKRQIFCQDGHGGRVEAHLRFAFSMVANRYATVCKLHGAVWARAVAVVGRTAARMRRSVGLL
jgi:hypothetical protein